jgi:predicted transporter
MSKYIPKQVFGKIRIKFLHDKKCIILHNYYLLLGIHFICIKIINKSFTKKKELQPNRINING